MSFNQLKFLVFFPLVTALYFLIPHKHRWTLLLMASCLFYMAFIPAYILVLFTAILIDYWAGIWIEAVATGVKKKLFLILSISSNVLLLFIFKYINFFNANLNALAGFLHWNYPARWLSIILPIGLSFHTFQSLSYVIEVFKGKQKAERHFGIYALYVMFYPQLVAGPIERPQNLLHQFYEKHEFDYARVTNGLKLMAWGYFKKLMIADRLAIYVNQVFGHPADFHGFSVLVAIYFFSFQIFCDFSGYSDIAIGAAEVMGFRLSKNFDWPYAARSVSEFWKRWHISLSSWFRDYVYIPLGGSRVSRLKFCRNILIVFMLSGLWHGANWTFIIWGLLNGFYFLFSEASQNIRKKWTKGLAEKFPSFHQALQVVITFHLISFSWIFFRAKSLSEAFLILKNLFLFSPPVTELELSAGQIRIGILAIYVMELIHCLQRRFSVRSFLAQRPALVRWAVYYVFLLGILAFGEYGQKEFIYFQF